MNRGISAIVLIIAYEGGQFRINFMRVFEVVIKEMNKSRKTQTHFFDKQQKKAKLTIVVKVNRTNNKKKMFSKFPPKLKRIH